MASDKGRLTNSANSHKRPSAQTRSQYRSSTYSSVGNKRFASKPADGRVVPSKAGGRHVSQGTRTGTIGTIGTRLGDSRDRSANRGASLNVSSAHNARKDRGGSSGSDSGSSASKRKNKGFSRLKKILITLACVAFALGITYVVLSYTNVFEITSVEVEGSTRLSDSYLTSAVSVPKGTNLLNVDAANITSRITKNAWVSSVRVKRQFPHTLVLQINENTPLAVVEVAPNSANSATQYWLIGSDCTWMGQVSQEGMQNARKMVISSTGDAGSSTTSSATNTTQSAGDGQAQTQNSESLANDGEAEQAQSSDTADTSSQEQNSQDSSSQDQAVQDSSSQDQAAQSSQSSDSQQEASICTDVYYTATELSKIPIITQTSSDITPEIGAIETDSGITNAIQIIEESKDDFGDEIATITSASGSSTGVTLKNGVEISFGEAQDMDTKIAVAQDLLNKYEGQISYINVRVASRPAWRGTNE